MQNKKTGKYRAVITHANAKTVPWRQLVATELKAVVGDSDVLTGPVSMQLDFIMPRRKAEPKRVTPAHTRKPDLDKLARAIGDAMTGIVYKDDSQVVDLRTTKRTALLDEESGVLIQWSEQ